MFARKMFISLAGSALITASAIAADLPSQQLYRAPVVAPAFSWTGFYLGAMGGYAFGAGNTSSLSGGLVGGTVGFNYQPAGSWVVLGLEGDAA